MGGWVYLLLIVANVEAECLPGLAVKGNVVFPSFLGRAGGRHEDTLGGGWVGGLVRRWFE